MKTNQLFFLLFFPFLSVFAQSTLDATLLRYKEYHEAPQEALYLHMNKQVAVPGEPIGYSIYAVEVASTQPSEYTRNVYVTISNEDLEIVSQKMILVEGATGVGLIETEKWKPGIYKIQAFTRFMKNFENPFAFQANFQIVNDTDPISIQTEKSAPQHLKATFSPEGGHLIAGVPTTVGVTVKDSEGKGYSREVTIKTEGKEVTTLITDERGMGRFKLIPIAGQSYTGELITDKVRVFQLPRVSNTGWAVSMTPWEEMVNVDFIFKAQGEDQVADKDMVAIIHQGRYIKTLDLAFQDSKTSFSIDKSSLPAGISTLTLFESGKEVLSRKFFNEIGFKNHNIKVINRSQRKDSIQITLKDYSDQSLINASVSVLPAGTISVDTKQSAFNELVLYPHVEGYIERPRDYFKDTSIKTLYNLDNLLLTQPRYVYDWNNNKSFFKRFPLEEGVSAKVTVHGKLLDQYLLMQMQNSPSKLIDESQFDSRNTVYFQGLMPYEDEKFNFTGFSSSGRVKKPAITPTFYPSVFPTLDFQDREYQEFAVEVDTISNSSFTSIISPEAEVLDEVVIKAQKTLKRRRDIERKTRGTVYLFDDNDREQEFNLSSWLNKHGFRTRQNLGTFTISNPIALREERANVNVVFNGTLLFDYSFLVNLDMATVDYIAINKSGIGYGLRAGGGPVIIIETDESFLWKERRKDTFLENKFPLAYSTPKDYYRPQYMNKQTKKFENIGSIHWVPELKFTYGVASFMIPADYDGALLLTIEGINEEGSVISQTLELSKVEDTDN